MLKTSQLPSTYMGKCDIFSFNLAKAISIKFLIKVPKDLENVLGMPNNCLWLPSLPSA